MAPKAAGSSTTGREEVDGLHEGGLVVEAEDAGVVAGAVVDQHARVVGWGQGAQDLGELGGAELARSTRAGDPLGERGGCAPARRSCCYRRLCSAGLRRGSGPAAARRPRRARTTARLRGRAHVALALEEGPVLDHELGRDQVACTRAAGQELDALRALDPAA